MRSRHYSYHKKHPKLIIIIIIFFVLLLTLDFQLRPIIISISQNAAKQVSMEAINNTVSKQLKSENVKYDDMVNIERDEGGKVLAITTNIIKMNDLKANVLLAVQQKLADRHIDKGIAVGTLLGNDFLHGRGPEIPLKLTLSANVNGDYKSNFEAAGINQTRHQIYLQIHTSVYSFIPGFNSTTDVTTDILVAETIIVGEVPQVYANLDKNLDSIIGSSSTK